MRLAAVVLAFAFAACSSSAQPAKGGPAVVAPTTPVVAAGAITGAADAIARFKAAWIAEVRPTMAGHQDPMIGMIDETMREPAAGSRYSAARKPCREASKMMVDLMAQSHYDFVLHGSMAAAHARDQCWEVRYICCMKGDAGALLDPDTGALLVVWRIPEG